jgi:periplasmic protein TonB
MAVAIATFRPRIRFGPALRPGRLPMGALALSAVLHVALAVVIVLAGHVWRASQPKTYIVNLVPAVAAVGSPQGRARSPEPVLPRVSTPTPPAPTPAPSLPEREPGRTPERPTRATDLPERTTTPRESVVLPDRAVPPRAPALPRPGEKELPRIASAPSEPPTSPSTARSAPPPPPLGQATGSPHGAGVRTLTVSDFPYAWYISTIQRKLEEQWDGKAVPGRQPEIIFEIDRSGRLRNPLVAKSSGNPLYDRVALRAVTDAAPFPPLPAEFPKSELSVGVDFSVLQR